MKSFARSLSLLLATLMIISSMFAMCVSADETNMFSDVNEGNRYFSAIDALVNRGVINGYEDGTFKPDNTITRAEFATILSRATAKGITLSATTDKFSDVSKDHWANIYIAHAVSTGAVNGYEDGTFRPDNEVTYGEAVKMIVCTMGYGKVVTPTEPWYQAYITVANQIGLTKNAAGDGEIKANRGLVAQLIYNVDNCKEIVQTGYNSDGSPKYESSSNKYEEETGIITAAYEKSLDGKDTGLNKQQIKIDDKIFYIGDVSMDKFTSNLGRKVTVKYEDGSKKTIKSVESITSRKEVTIKDSMIESVSDRTITYYAKDTDREASEATLASKINVIFNGYGVDPSEIDDDFIAKYFNVATGEITLINNASGSTYNVAYITSYDTYFVTSVTSNGDMYTIYDTYGPNKEIQLDADKCEVYKVSSIGGTATTATMSSVVKNTVVSIAKPLSTDDDTKVMVSASKVTGRVDSVSSSTEITISNKDYDKSKYYDYLVETDSSKYSLSNGDNASFYFDYKDRLVYFSKAESTDPYAYITGVVTGGLSGKNRIQLFTTSGTTVAYTLKDKVKINGTSYSSSTALDILAENATAINAKKDATITKNAEYAQVVKYKTAVSDGETVISELFTINATEPESGEIVPAEFRYSSKDAKDIYSDGKSKLKYRTSGKAFQDDASTNQFIINTTTIIFNIPDDRGDVDNYKKKTYSYFSDGGSYVVEPYDVTSNVAKVILVYAGGASTAVEIKNTTNCSLIESVRDVKSGDDKVQKVTYYNAGTDKLTETNTDKDGIMSGVSAGDVVKFGIEDGKITGYQKLYVGGKLYDFKDGDPYNTFEADKNYIVHAENSSSEYKAILGTVTAVGDGVISVVPQIVDDPEDFDAAAWTSYNVSSSTKYYKWDSKNGKYDMVTQDALVASDDSDPILASKVLVISISKAVKAVYILDK